MSFTVVQTYEANQLRVFAVRTLWLEAPNKLYYPPSNFGKELIANLIQQANSKYADNWDVLAAITKGSYRSYKKAEEAANKKIGDSDSESGGSNDAVARLKALNR